MSLKKNKWEFFAALALAIIFGVATVAWFKKIESKNETVKVARAAADLRAPKIIRAEDLAVTDVPSALVPGGALKNPDKLVGMVLTRDIIKDGWFSEYDMVYGRDPSSDGTVLPAGSLGAVLPANWFVGPLPRVRARDFVYIFAANPRVSGNLGKSGLLVGNLPVTRVETQKDQTASIVVVLNAKQAEALVEARAGQIPMLLTVASVSDNSMSSSTASKQDGN